MTEPTHIINNTYRGQQKSLNHTTKICELQIKFRSVLCNVRSKALNVRSKALNVRSKALNVRSKSLNGLFYSCFKNKFITNRKQFVCYSSKNTCL